MSFHTTHNEHYILLEPEFEYLETEDLDDIINLILGDNPDIAHVILFAGTLSFLADDDLDQLKFLNEELMAKSGYLLLVTTSETLQELVGDPIKTLPGIDEAIDLIESDWLERDLFSE